MSFITWTLDLDTGFADIDDQHKELVDKINKFYDVYQTGNVVDIKIALQELLDYTVYHFSQEEKMLEEANYRMLEPHKKVHFNFVSKIKNCQASIENGDLEAGKELINLLDGWLFRHIRLNDHGYVADVKKAGVR